MPSNIYNEGRVVGYSAYEIYVRHSLSEDPERPPASEIEWLSSTVAMGSSMLLKISAEDEGSDFQGHHSRIFCLPENSNLAAANTIVGSLFLGTAECDGYWASKITSYGSLLTNNVDYPIPGNHSNQDDERPFQPNPHTPLSETEQNQILNYMKIVDGIVIQPGEWFTNGEANQPPTHDFSPKFNGKNATIKLYFSDRITEDFYILFTGFTLKSVLHGVSGMDGSTDTSTNMWENGGFLGPAVFPWANKIVFSVPPAYANYFLDARYKRAIQNTSLESFENSEAVKSVSVVDIVDSNSYYESPQVGASYIKFSELTERPTDWSSAYKKYYKYENSQYTHVTGSTAPNASGTWPKNTYFKKIRPCIDLRIDDCNKTSGDNVLTVYQRNVLLPPALYASKISDTGEQTLNPVDTVAPGTIKLYENKDDAEVVAKALENEIPGNYAFLRETSDYVLKELNAGQSVVPVAEASIVDLANPLRFVDLLPPFFYVEGSFNKDGEPYPSGREHLVTDLELVNQSAISLKRITGKLSSKIQELCGYDIDDPAFQSTGIWKNATMNLVNQIPSAERSEYYYLVNAKASTPPNPIVFPVRKSTHIIDVTIWYGIELQVNGKKWYAQFVNDSSAPAKSAFLGSWWSGTGFTDYDYTIAGTNGNPAYQAGWAYIIGDEHPTILSRIDTSEQLVYVPRAILPSNINNKPYEEYYKEIKLNEIFTSQQLDGIATEFRNYSLHDVLYTALYRDLGTGELLSSTNKNVQQPLHFCKNTAKSAGDAVTVGLTLSLSNNQETVGKPQYVKLPKNLSDVSTSATGVLTQTGNKQTISLSMTDKNIEMYKFTGADGDISPYDGKLHWDDLLSMLSNNKAIDLLNSETFLRNLMAFLNSHINAGTGINSQYDTTNNNRTLSLSTENGSGISIAAGTSGDNGDSSGKHISANLSADKGISISGDSASTAKRIGVDLSAGYGISISDAESPSNAKIIETKFRNGSGIIFNEVDGKIQIDNAMMPGSLSQLTKGDDFNISFGVSAGCCGKFQPAASGDSSNDAVYITYSKSVDGSPANIYVHGGPRLGISDFGRNSAKIGEDGGGFWFRHTNTDDDRKIASRMFKISFTGAGLRKLGLTSTYGIKNIVDTSGSFTGIWNVGPKPGIIPQGSCGESWSASCMTEFASASSIYVFGISYADGYNQQIGNHKGITHNFDSSQLYSTHINLLVSCQLYPKTS